MSESNLEMISEVKKTYSSAKAKVSKSASEAKADISSKIMLIKNEIYKEVNPIIER